MDKDVFGIWALQNAKLSGQFQIPAVKSSPLIPDALVPFSKRNKASHPKNKALHFYEYDYIYDSITRSKVKTDSRISLFKKFQSVILPDYSIYRDMPLYMQINQVGRSRAYGNYLISNGVNVIPNIRWGKENSYCFVFDGIAERQIVAVGAMGAWKTEENLYYFESGFCKMLEVLKPAFIIIYGTISEQLKTECRKCGCNYLEYDTEKAKCHDPQRKTDLLLF